MLLQKHAPKHEFCTFPLFQRTHVTLNVGYACVSDLTAALGTSFINNKHGGVHGGRKNSIPFTSKNMRLLHDKYAILRHFKELNSQQKLCNGFLHHEIDEWSILKCTKIKEQQKRLKRVVIEDYNSFCK